MTSEASFYSERLAHKEHELDELQAAFNKYKLKAKVKFDQLRKEVNAYCSGNGYSLNERENNALLLIRLAENETAMEAACREAEVLRKEVARKQTQLNDQLILIKNMEEQIRSSQPMSPVEIQERKRAAQMIDLDKIQQQMLFKDERIVELNNVILDKERQILDLQELCREQGEVASVTSQAARIVQRQWEDKNRERREVGTETDSSLWNSTTRIGQRDPEVRARSDSPGRAVVNNRGTANTSPPPLDPSEVLERTSRRDEADDHLGASNSFLGKSSELDSSFRKKNRKRVTFDLLSTFQQQQQQQAARTPSGEQFTQVVIELSEENERLRKALLEARTNLDQLQSRADEVDADMTRLVREGKNQALKARAVAQARIKELEDRMAELNGQHADQIDRLQTEIESLRSTREWEVEQNAQLREQLNEAKNKNHKLTEELDASEKANREWEVKMTHGEEFLDQLIEDLAEAEDIINYMEQQKHSILDDVDKLKDAIIAQDQLIEILEADIVIYEEHIGILRESLGASKIDHRSLLRSKAFETKLKALEKEKEQINRRSNEDRLRTKALSQKCKVLEEENEKLMEKLCELEMRERDEAEMAETCRQLEQKIAEAEQKAAVSKAECDLRVEAARLEAESKSKEAAELLRELRGAQQKLSVRSSSVERREHAGRPEQPSMNLEVEQLRSQAAEQDLQLAHLRLEVAQVNELREELEVANRKCVETAEELDAIRCSNFELMTKVDSYSVSLKAAEQERDSLREMYEKMSVTLSQKERQEAANDERTTAIEKELEMTEAELQAARQESEGLSKELATVQSKLTQTELSLASYRVDLGESHERINRLEEELFATRAELDNARLGLQETNNVKKELEHLKEALEHERSSGRAKWEEVCRKVLECESSLPQSRKSSLEVINKVQHLEYITAFEEKITCLESELQEARTKIEQEKAEKKKLKAALKQMRVREKNATELTEVQQQSATHPCHATVTREQPLQAAPPSVLACEGDLEKLKNTVRELELENRLSRELNTEYSHTMLEMEKEVIALKAQITSLRGESEHFEMELKLREMLEEELEKELTDARLKNQELSEAVQSQEESLERFSERVTNDVAKNDEYTNGLVAEVYQLREQEILLKEQLRVAAEKLAAEESFRAQEREHFSDVDRAHCEEVRELSISLADARRMISDVEVRLAEAEGNFTESQSQVASLRTALDAKTLEIRELQQEITLLREKTALLRGASSTPEVVASVLVGKAEAVRRDVNLEAEPETHVSQEGVTSAALEDMTLGEDAEGTRTTAVPHGSDLFAENLILRQCVNETNQMQNDLSQDVEKMWQLKTELENAVEALKGEIWSLNGQLKASILDREQLQDQVIELDSSLAAEKKRADALDCELSEQTELTEKASRQAAEAENESNRRLAECLEMETRREQVEKAYAQLTEYYSQLQAAYNVIYSQLKQIEAERAAAESAQQASTSDPTNDDNVRHVVDTMIAELHLEVGIDVDLHGKVLLIQKALREKLAELSEHHQAIAEHRRTNEALHEQLRSLEEETHKAGDQTADAKARLLHLEGELEWKQDECDSLRRRVNELQAAIDQLVDRDSETDALAASRLRIELAILAAKLATRQADVDALFRANAELAHTNVRLQNELEQSEEWTSPPDELRRLEELQEELSASKSNEETLQRQLAEVRAILNETEQKLEEFSLSERTSKASRSVETQNETSEAAASESFHEVECSTSCVGIEEVMKDHDKWRDEVERLQAVEKLLNERIMCLEDQLLEEEEKLQEFEEELISERRKVKVLEAEKQSAAQFEVVSNTNQGMSEESQWGFTDPADAVEKDVQLQLGFTKGQEHYEQADFYAQDSWVADVSGSAASRQQVEDELAQVRDELEQLKMKLDEQKRVTPSRRDDGEAERTESEWNALKRELSVLQEALLKKEAATAGTEQSEDAWGWEDSQARGFAELSTLQKKFALMASVEQEHKEIIKKQQDRISKLEEELSTADSYREELEDASKQVNDLQREIREMKKQAKLREEKEERFKVRISALEAKAENSWPDEWGADVDRTEEEVREVEQSRAETCRRIEELELKVKEKESALAAAEDELSKLRRDLDKSREESRRETSASQTAFEDSSWNDQAAAEAGNQVELERQMREEAEALADGLRRVAATLRIQVDELQEKVLAEQEAAARKSTEIDGLRADNDRLRTAIASRTELQEAEHQRSESEQETLREERRRIQDDLSSAENEKIRLEEQLMASKMKCDDLSTELQLQRADSSELRQTIQELNERCESAQAMLQTVEAEKSSLLDRLSETEGDLDEVKRQLRASIEREQMSSSTNATEMTKWEQLEQILGDVRRELAEKELQNSLLKDSEAKLLDSVDEYGSQAEKYQREAERLQTVVNRLEKERMALEEEIEDMKKNQNRHVEDVKGKHLLQEGTSSSPSLYSRELSLVSGQLEALTAERNELRNRLEKAESRLEMSLKEKQAVSRSYEQLRARLAARRQVATASNESSRRSRASTSEVDASEVSPPRAEEPARSSSGTFISYQEDAFRAQSYRESITVFMDEVECFLEEQELNYGTVTAIIDGLDSTHTARTPNMGKKKTPARKAATETLDAGDLQSPCFHERSARSEMSEEGATALQVKITHMQEHSARLIAEYNKKLDALIHENALLSQEIQEFRSLDTANDSASSSAEPQRLRSYMITTFALLTSMTSEISDFSGKRGRIVENAKGYLTSVSEASVDGGTECELPKGDVQLMEAVLDKLTQSKQKTGRMSGSVEGLDDSSTFQTASSSEPWNSECPSQLSASVLLLKQHELNEQLISERLNHEEKLNSLRSILLEERERMDALQSSFDDLNRRYGDVANELDRTRTTYNQVVDELEATKQENIGRLSKQAASYELEIAQVQEFAQRIESERSTLRIENSELSENLTAFEHRITLLQANELEVSSRYEDLLRKCRSLEESLAVLSRGPNGNPDGLRTRLEDSEISGDCDTILSNGEEVLESETKDLMSSGEEKQPFSQPKDYNGPQEQRGEKIEESVLMESEVCALNEDFPYSIESVMHTIEMQESPSAIQIELLALKEENAALTSTISEYKEMMRSTEKDLEETRCCCANEKEKYLRQAVESDELWTKKLHDTEDEVVALNRRITSTELELSEAISLNTDLQSRIRQYEAMVSEINGELCSKITRVSALEDGLQKAENSLVDAQRQRATEVAMLKEELDDANALLDRLSCQLEVNSRKQAVEECERQLAVAKAVATHSEKQMQLITGERDRAVSELNSTKAMLYEAECRLSDSVARSENLVREFGTEREKLSNELYEAIKSKESLVKELSNVKEELVRKEGLCEGLQSNITRLNEESKMLSSKLSEISAEKGTISRQNDLAVEECAKAQKVLESVECSLLATTAQRDELLVRVSDLCSACKELEDRLAALTSSYEERCSNLEAALEDSEKRALAAAVLEEVLRSKNNDVELLQSKTRRMEEDLLVARTQLDQLSEHTNALLQTLLDRDAAVERLETEVARLQMQLREKQENDTALQLQSSVEKKRGEETIAHLRDDNVRLERELCLSHEQLECAKSELAALRLSIEHSDAAALKARNDNQRLMEQLERALFEKEQTLAMAGEGREAATRVIALERSIAVLKSEHAERMKQALEDLEASEHKLRVLKDSAEQDRNQREEAVGKMESLRSRFELAAQEIESLTRSIEEVRHLESALEKSRTEQTALYEELTSQRSLLDRVLAEKDALLDQLTALNGQLDERTNRLRQVGEAKMDTTLRIVELESQVAALLRERDGVAGESEFNRASCNELTANISGPGAESAKQVAVQIEGNIRPGEVERLRLDLQKAQERIAELEEFEGSVGDNHVLNADTSRSSDRLEGSEWPYQFISASTPFPSLVTLLSRRFSAFRHRPARALMPYFRLAMAAYSILLHIMLIHCWFFAVCP